MKKTIMTVLVAVTLALMLAGCEGRKGTDELPNANLGAPTKTVSRADITEALWSTEKEPPEDAGCITTSKFTFDRTNPLIIKKASGRPTDFNTSLVIVVGPINLTVAAKPDKPDEPRNERCAEGELSYLLTASEEVPIDILLSKKLSYSHDLNAVARNTAAPYPDNCKITAHFEKHGEGECTTGSAWVLTEEKKADARISASGENDEARDDNALPSGMQIQLSAIGECIEPMVQTFALIVDGYDCTSKPVKR